LNWLLCGGLFPGDLIYLAAKGGEGKSALALELARHVSLASGVLIISQEMSVGAVVRRLLSQESKVNARKMKQRTLSPSDWEPLTKAASSMSTRKGWIISQAPTIEAMTAALKLTTGVKLVIVDYLQLLSAKGQDSRAQLEAVSRGLKAFALTHGVAVFCLSAVTTRGEGNQKPSMHWLRGSGMLEHDCDVALLLHQPNSASPNRELIVAKARDAECGSINLTFSPEILHFVETELRQPDPTDQWERA
jgi:replicative DNA helicase